MADIEKSIAECCNQLRLSSNFAGQAMTQKGDSQQKHLLNLPTNEIEYRLIKRKSTYLKQYTGIGTGRIRICSL